MWTPQVNGYDIMRSTFATLRILLEMFNLKRSTKPAAGGKSLKNKQILKWQTVRSAYPVCHTMCCVQIPTCSLGSTISHKTFYPWMQLSIFSALRIWLQKIFSLFIACWFSVPGVRPSTVTARDCEFQSRSVPYNHLGFLLIYDENLYLFKGQQTQLKKM